MAEERLIDDDLNKDKKYRIRKNADGEDELYIDDSVEEEQADLETVSFSVPEFSDGDGELTPEQIAAAEQEKRERAERIKGALSVNIEKAQAKLAEEDFEGAITSVEAALQVDPASGAAWALKLKILTKNFTDFENIDDCVETAENVVNYCGDDQKAELTEAGAPLESRIMQLEEQAAALHVEVEEKKSERRTVFLENRKKSVKWFSITFIPFIACLVIALAFIPFISARKDGLNAILAIVFAVLAALFFIATLFTAHKMWDDMKKLSLNEKNSSTQMGRDYEKMLSDIKKLNTVLHSFKKPKQYIEFFEN